MKKGQTLPPKQRIRIELPEGFLGAQGSETLEGGIPKWRLVGAGAAGVGAYLMVRVMQKGAADIARGLAAGAGNLFLELAKASTFITEALTGVDPFGGVGPIDPEVLFGGPESLIAPDPFAISIGIIFGGMVLAGQNPAELIKGLGEIIPG